MLQSSEQLKAANAPNWQIHQAVRREAAAYIEQQSRARRNQSDQMPEPTIAIQHEGSKEFITSVAHKKTQKEIKSSYKTLQRMNRIDASVTAQNEVRRNSMSPLKLTDEEQLEANKQRQELYERLAEPLLDHNYTARAGSIINFPTELIGDLIHTAKRATASNAARFGFVSHGHEIGFYKDNTPTALLKKAGYIDNTDAEPVQNNELTDELIDLIEEFTTIMAKQWEEEKLLIATNPSDSARAEELSHQIDNLTKKQPIDEKLTASEWAVLEDYLFDFDLIAWIAEDAIAAATKKSEITDEDIIKASRITAEELILSLQSSIQKNKKDRDMQMRGIEALGLHSQVIGGAYGQKKCSSSALRGYLKAKEKQEHFQKTHFITDGKISIPFSEAGRTAEKQNAKMRAVAKGMQKYGEKENMEWAAFICTLESEYHANPLPRKDDPNKKHHFNGVLPKEASQVLSARYEAVRKSLGKRGIRLITLRTNESMQDATPHTNILVQYPAGAEGIVIKAFKKHFAHNDGAALRCILGREEAASGKKATYATYFTKYFTKFRKINGKVEIDIDVNVMDEIDVKVRDEIEIEAAWRRANKIRGYGFSGAAPLNHWDLLRSRSVAPKGKIKGDLLFDAWKAAREGDFERFMRLTGGSGIKRKDRKLQTIHEFSTPENLEVLPRKIAVGVVDAATGEELTLKILGQWRLTALPFNISAKSLKTRLADKKAKSKSNLSTTAAGKTATVVLRLPRGGASAAQKLPDPPPKIINTLH